MTNTALYAVADGIASFQANVASGLLPRALPFDGAHCVIAALKAAGFKIVRAPAKRDTGTDAKEIGS
jgi:hypothetical protein